MNRPSLLSGGTPGQTGSSPPNRILADMEGRTVATPTPRREPKPRPPRTRKRWPLVAVVPAVLLLAGFGWWWIGSPSASQQQKPAGGSQVTIATNQATAIPANGAVIVDDRAAEQADAPRVDTSTSTTSTSNASTLPPAISTAATAVSSPPEPTTPPVPAVAHAPSSAPAKTPRNVVRNQSKSGSSKTSDQDLIGTLMGIIKQKEPTKGSKPESMDSLIAQIQADQSRNAAANQAAIDSIDPANSAHSEVQVKLRRCPPANTAKGLECRRKICAKMAGKDAACPAP